MIQKVVYELVLDNMGKLWSSQKPCHTLYCPTLCTPSLQQICPVTLHAKHAPVEQCHTGYPLECGEQSVVGCFPFQNKLVGFLWNIPVPRMVFQTEMLSACLLGCSRLELGEKINTFIFGISKLWKKEIQHNYVKISWYYFDLEAVNFTFGKRKWNPH